MKFLADSNILLRSALPSDPQYPLATNATKKLLIANEELCIVPQIIYEFWSVATRPTNVNGLGLSGSQALSELVRLRSFLAVFDEVPQFFIEWEKLIAQHAIIGKNAHDTRLVAAMVVHGITHLLTFNKQDFQRFTNITVLTPADVLASP